MDNCGNSIANTCIQTWLLEGLWSLVTEPTQALLGILVIHDDWMNYMATAGNKSFQFLTYQLPTVRYWLTVAMTGDGGLGFDSGEGAWEMATTSKEGSRRANYPILTQGGSDNKYQCTAFFTVVQLEWEQLNELIENQLEGKSGASSRGNSSSNSVY